VATKATAPRPVRGMRASASIARDTTGALASTYPPITTNTICIVKGTRLQ
jgi:hypothetical protein